MCVKLGLAKFQPSSAREKFSNQGLNGGGRKNLHFSMENWPYLVNGERYGQNYY